MEKVLNEIKKGKYQGPFLERINKRIANRKDWYKIGKVVTKGHPVSLHREQIRAAKRSYIYYRIDKGNWERPSPRDLGKMRQKEFAEVLKRREHRGEILLEIILLVLQSRDENT